MKKFLTLLLTVALTATLAITGTIAYLTDTDQEVNVMTLGNVKVELIEQQRNDDRTALEPFEQGKKLTPIVGSASDLDGFGMSNATNYVDKVVTAKLGASSNDAYVRILIAVPAALEDVTGTGASHNALHWNFGNRFDASKAGKYNQPHDWKTTGNPFFDDFGTGATGDVKDVEISGIKYNVYNFTVQHVVEAGEETAAPLIGFYLDSTVNYDHKDECYVMGEKKIDYDLTNVSIPVMVQAVQVDGFADATAAFNGAFGEFNAANAAGWFGGTTISEPDNDADLESALTGDNKTIVVNLTNDMTYDVDAWSAEAMGGEKTEKIVINGNGHTLTFNHKNSDWNNIAANGATLVLNNVNITNSGHNNGPWNRHDLNFACDVEMNNVTSDKAFAFKAGAALKNVTITDANTSDTYAIWIQPNGQTVTLDGCTIDMITCSDGRGIKIDEQYVSTPGKVTLVVKDTTFKTEEKSAILVKSVAGADITLENVNIAGVSADSTNTVWVDSASAAYADLVTVTGGSKIVEP